MATRRAKAVAKTQELLGAHGTCRVYAFGVTGPEPQRSLLWMIGSVIGFCVVVVLATGIILIPGLLAIAAARWAINNPRGVCVADQGIAVTKERFSNARPSSIVAQLPLEQLLVVSASTATHVCVQLGTENVWLRRREHEILTAAANAALSRTG